MPRPVTLPTTLALIALIVPACISIERGDTIFRVDTAHREEESTLRRELWRVDRAAEDIRVRYGLEDTTIEVIVGDLGGLGQTSPALSGLADVSGAVVHLNKLIFLEEHPDLDQIIEGLLAHELMHALHYARMSTRDLVTLGERYDAMMSDPDGPQREWVRAYERLTDLMTIRMGYGESLIHQKRASEDNLARNHPPLVWDFYLHEDEIGALLEDPAALERETAAMLEAVGLESLARLNAALD
ncbi:MAG: hypothetical protein ACF8SC_00250 [Phycisphaerales bacterium JB037]